VTEIGLAGGHPLCMEALTLFSRIYGAAAGNLALHVLAYGGVYIGGGIAPRILAKLKDGSFMQGFTSKGRYVGFLKEIRVRVALNPLAPLIGAAHFARSL
jgi:glucokinase